MLMSRTSARQPTYINHCGGLGGRSPKHLTYSPETQKNVKPRMLIIAHIKTWRLKDFRPVLMHIDAFIAMKNLKTPEILPVEGSSGRP